MGKLQNYPHGSRLEMDLALSKLRNLYDVLSNIRDDAMMEGWTAPEPRREVVPEPAPVASPPVPEPAPVVPEPAPAPTPVAPPPPPAVPEEPAPAVVAEPPKETSGPPPAPKKDPAILADTFAGAASLNENLAGKKGPSEDGKVLGEPIQQISRNIGINDRFLMIRELVEGSAEAFGLLVEALDNAGSYPAARSILLDRFPGDQDHEGVQILHILSKRRYPG
ncbi:MAG: hypothetical protein R2751_02270 [Bacteroidales bacterium]